MRLPNILLVDNDRTYIANVKDYLESHNFQVTCAYNPTQAKNILEQRDFALAVIDYRLLNDEDEMDDSGRRLALETIKLPKVIMTKFNKYEYAVNSLKPQKNGRSPAINFFVKQEGLGKLLSIIRSSMPKSKIFLCYAKPDTDQVASLYDRLEEQGFSPWMDQKSLKGGENWQLAIRNAIRSVDFFVVCLSKNAINRRGFMQKEIRLALNMLDEKLEDDIYVIPLRLDDCQINHERLKGIQWVDLFNPNGYSRLVEAIQTGTKRREVK